MADGTLDPAGLDDRRAQHAHASRQYPAEITPGYADRAPPRAAYHPAPAYQPVGTMPGHAGRAPHQPAGTVPGYPQRAAYHPADTMPGYAERPQRAPRRLAPLPPHPEARAHATATQLRRSPNLRDHYDVLPHLHADQLRVRGPHHGAGPAAAVSLAPQQGTPGALNPSYDVPEVHFRRSAVPLILASSLLLVAVRTGWHLTYVLAHGDYWALMPIWVLTFGVPSLTLFLSWLDRPYAVTPRQQQQLNRLYVAVAVPVYNEDPELLDRCLWSLANSSRPPEEIHVVEDGPSGDYTAVREHWLSVPGVRWTRLPANRGKKHAQAAVFSSCPRADIFITVDSDTTLERHAISEGLKPFANPRIASVAGIEEVYNKQVNWLTLTCAVRNTVSQLIAWSTQSVFGDVLINRGTFALYRAHIIREIIPAYLGETFLGRPVRLGDDSALTLFARAHGRTVQQVSAFCLPMYPENLSHHFRQWLRWARGGSVRNYWRIRYLSPRSWSWWWIVFGLYYIPISAIVPVVYAVTWPASARVVGYIGILMISWAYAVCPRTLCVRREGESRLFRLGAMLMYPAGIIWTSVVLRPIRLYGIVTWFKQGWVTRTAGIEVTATHFRGP